MNENKHNNILIVRMNVCSDSMIEWNTINHNKTHSTTIWETGETQSTLLLCFDVIVLWWMMEEQEVIACLCWREIDGNEKSMRRYFKTTQRTNIHLCSFQPKLSVYQYFYSVCLFFWWFDLNDLEEKGEQKHVGNNWSSLMRTCIVSESTLSSRVCVFGMMKVICWDYEKGKVMSACVCDELIEFIWRCSRMKECVEDVVVRNWDGMETIWNDTFITKLCVVVEKEYTVLDWYSLTSKQKQKKRWQEWCLNHLLFLNWLYQPCGHRTGIDIAISCDDCHNMSVKWQLCSSWLCFRFWLLEGMSLMGLWLNWWMKMFSQ